MYEIVFFKSKCINLIMFFKNKFNHYFAARSFCVGFFLSNVVTAVGLVPAPMLLLDS